MSEPDKRESTNVDFDLEFLIQQNLLVITLRGELTNSAVISICDEVERNPNFRIGMYRIWDVRLARMMWTPKDTRELASYWNREGHVHSTRRCAVVVADKYAFGMLRMYTIRRTDGMPVFEVTYSLEDAYEWINA